MRGADATLRVVGLTDLDRVTLEKEFSEAHLPDILSFDDHPAQAGGVGALDPVTAVVIVSGMAFTTLAAWLCRSQRADVTVEGPDGRTKIVVSQSSSCKADVLAQLLKLFPAVSR